MVGRHVGPKSEFEMARFQNFILGSDGFEPATTGLLTHRFNHYTTRLVRVMVAGGVVVIAYGCLRGAPKGASPYGPAPSHMTLRRRTTAQARRYFKRGEL